MKRACVDFDGTIVEEYVEWPAVPKLLPGARAAVQELRDKGWYIIIFSARNNPQMINQKQKYQQMVNLLKEYQIPYDEIWEYPKPIATIFIDDRNTTFKGWY